jgi:hypothetical protein
MDAHFDAAIDGLGDGEELDAIPELSGVGDVGGGDVGDAFGVNVF